MSKLQSVGSVAGKETIYVDVDDEITAIIDKVRSAKGKVIALVLPKRATVLQSIVNMKLLKHTADNAGKNLALITTEAGLMPLAGAVGLHVAATPNSRPEIPAAPAEPGNEPEDIDEPLNIADGSEVAVATDFDRKAAANKSVGELAAAGAGFKPEADIDESIDMSEPATPVVGGAAGVPKPKKNRKLAVPNFDSFRKKIALGVVMLVVLIVGWIFAMVVLPKATVTIKTDTTTVSTNSNLTLDTTAKTLNKDDAIVPATQQSQQKTDTQQVAATGTQNNGEKASGQVTFTLNNCDSSSATIPTGASISASGGLTFITQSGATLNSVKVGNQCNPSSFKSFYSATIPVIALKAGANYNLASGTKFTISSVSGVAAEASTEINGGTDNIIKVVAQTDIDSATAKIKAADTTTLKQQLVSALQTKGLQAVTSTFLAGDPQVTTSAKAGDTADTVTVTAVTNYTMLGVKKSDLATLVETNVNKQIDKSKQVILDNGVANAKFSQQSPATASGALVAMSVKSVAGPQLDADKLKTQVLGMKAGDVKKLVKQTPGVTDVTVDYSPFWVTAIPKKADKITIVIDKSGS